jgi:membrane associated rhomboid family serine protease
MDRTITRLPLSAAGDPLERALLEIDVAISLVLAGVAVTITLCCFEAAEGAAFTGAAWAQAAGIAFCLRREPFAPVSLVIGPRLRPPVTASVETES